MHELTVVKALIDSVENYRQGHNGDEVKSLTVEVGKLTCVDTQRMEFCFDMVKSDSDMAQTLLNIKRVTAEAQCQQCGKTFEINRPGEPCVCGSYKNTLLSGNELNLIEIEFV